MEQLTDAEISAARKRRKIVHGIILSGWVMTLLTMIAIVGASLWLILAKDFAKLPEELAQWSSIAIGFLFGTFSTVVQNFVSGSIEQERGP